MESPQAELLDVLDDPGFLEPVLPTMVVNSPPRSRDMESEGSGRPNIFRSRPGWSHSRNTGAFLKGNFAHHPPSAERVPTRRSPTAVGAYAAGHGVSESGVPLENRCNSAGPSSHCLAQQIRATGQPVHGNGAAPDGLRMRICQETTLQLRLGHTIDLGEHHKVRLKVSMGPSCPGALQAGGESNTQPAAMCSSSRGAAVAQSGQSMTRASRPRRSGPPPAPQIRDKGNGQGRYPRSNQ